MSGTLGLFSFFLGLTGVGLRGGGVWPRVLGATTGAFPLPFPLASFDILAALLSLNSCSISCNCWAVSPLDENLIFVSPRTEDFEKR